MLTQWWIWQTLYFHQELYEASLAVVGIAKAMAQKAVEMWKITLIFCFYLQYSDKIKKIVRIKDKEWIHHK